MVVHATKFGVPASQRATCNLQAHVIPITDVLHGTSHLKSAKAHVRRPHGGSRHTENVDVNTQHYLPSCARNFVRLMDRQKCQVVHQYQPSECKEPGLCSTHESWVKFGSTLTQTSRVRVESAVKIKDMSRVRVESRWSSFESELSQLDTTWVKVESRIFLKKTSIFCIYL